MALEAVRTHNRPGPLLSMRSRYFVDSHGGALAHSPEGKATTSGKRLKKYNFVPFGSMRNCFVFFAGVFV